MEQRPRDVLRRKQLFLPGITCREQVAVGSLVDRAHESRPRHSANDEQEPSFDAYSECEADRHKGEEIGWTVKYRDGHRRAGNESQPWPLAALPGAEDTGGDPRQGRDVAHHSQGHVYIQRARRQNHRSHPRPARLQTEFASEKIDQPKAEQCVEDHGDRCGQVPSDDVSHGHEQQWQTHRIGGHHCHSVRAGDEAQGNVRERWQGLRIHPGHLTHGCDQARVVQQTGVVHIPGRVRAAGIGGGIARKHQAIEGKCQQRQPDGPTKAGKHGRARPGMTK